MAEATLHDLPQEELVALLGARDENLRVLRETLDLRVTARHGKVAIEGSEADVSLGLKILNRMRSSYRLKRPLSMEEIRFWIDQGRQLGDDAELGPTPVIEIAGPMRRLRARSPGQSRYVQAIRNHDLTLGIGPPGSGKTYLAVGVALEALQSRQVKRIVLVRPLVEAGEKIGFLPGDLYAKVDPFLRPLLDALREMIDFNQVKTYLENDVIEIAPLAYMRGRTLNESFIILDEAQNTTVPQMKMLLTRMGIGSKIVVTGDLKQVDLPNGVRNGLADVIERLRDVPRIAIVEMQAVDIVRHPLVEAIVQAYGDK